MKTETDIQEIITQIRASEGENFVADEKAIVEEYKKRSSNQSNLAIKILSIAGGFLATLAFLGFLFIAGLYDSETSMILLGAVFIAGAILLNKVYDKLIIDTLSISVFVIGFFLLGLGLSKSEVNDNLISLLFMLIALISLIITRSYILIFISVLIFNGSILALILLNEKYDWIHLPIAFVALLMTFCFLKEAKIITSHKKLLQLYNPLRIGLIFSFIIGLAFVGKKGLVPLSLNYSWLSSIVIISILLYLIKTLFPIFNIRKTKDILLIYIASILILVPTAFSPAISGSLLIILLSFLVNCKTGLGLGILSFIYFISQYYYDLHFSLLIKSIILFSSGVLFILFYLFTYKKLGTHEEI